LKSGIPKKCIFHLHADMEDEDIECSKKPTGFARCIFYLRQKLRRR
jgi:hypothetical protein